MFLVIGDQKEELQKELNQAGYEFVSTGELADLEDSQKLRRYNFILINNPGIWKAAHLNSLWEVDSFVFIFGKVPPIVQVYAGIRITRVVHLNCSKISLEHPELDGLAGKSFHFNERVKNFQDVEIEGGHTVVTAHDKENGATFPFLTRKGRVCYVTTDILRLGRENRKRIVSLLANLISSLVKEYEIEVGSEENIPPGFDHLSSLVPSTFQGPNARDYSYVLRRVNRLFNVLTRFSMSKDLRDVSVLDVGCGFGTLTVVSSYLEKLKNILGVDYDKNLIDVGNVLAQKLQLESVSFSQKNMMELGDLGGKFDIVISNNSINYLPSNDDYVKTLENFYNVLGPIGSLIILTPSRLTPIEAFTKFPGVQFLTRSDANTIIRKNNLSGIDYEIIKLPSPFELFHWLKEVGFIDVKVIDAYSLKECDWSGYFKPRYYVVADKC